MNIINTDVKFDVFDKPNKGGQHVPSSNYGLSGTHVSTGLIAVCKSEKSQYRNREVVLAMLDAGVKKIEELEQKGNKNEY